MENKIYAEPGQSLQQFGGECPEGWVEMNGARPGETGEGFIAVADGSWIERPEDQSIWRTAELLVIERQLQAVEEDESDETPTDLLPGSKRQWLKYRGLVSNWKEGAEFFPDLEHRPIRPA